MTILFELIVAAVLLIVFVAVAYLVALVAAVRDWTTAHRNEKKQKEECACETCLRWSECNGVDEQCPHRKGNETE